VFILSLIPIIGSALQIISLSWLYSYYCFEYKTDAMKIKLYKSIDMFEKNSAYYLGFGIIFTTSVYYFPGLMSSGVFSLLYPIIVI
jgi:etoposide-induced 2.4 mRNA